MDPSVNLLNEFREKVYAELTAKGIKPPEPNSAQEVRLFEQWQHGREKLNLVTRKNIQRG